MNKDLQKVLIAVIGLIALGALIFGAYKDKQQFMNACLKDHKDYQCRVMWAQANPPVPVYTGH